MQFQMDPKRTTKRIIQYFNCRQRGSHVSEICESQSWCTICGFEHPTNRHRENLCQEKHEHAKDCIPSIELYCVNCGKDHTVFDRRCKMYQELWKKTEQTQLVMKLLLLTMTMGHPLWGDK